MAREREQLFKLGWSDHWGMLHRLQTAWTACSRVSSGSGPRAGSEPSIGPALSPNLSPFARYEPIPSQTDHRARGYANSLFFRDLDTKSRFLRSCRHTLRENPPLSAFSPHTRLIGSAARPCGTPDYGLDFVYVDRNGSKQPPMGQHGPPDSTRKKLSMSASVPVPPSPL